MAEKEPWCLATNLPDLTLTVRYYRRRMWTEEMFGDFQKTWLRSGEHDVAPCTSSFSSDFSGCTALRLAPLPLAVILSGLAFVMSSIAKTAAT